MRTSISTATSSGFCYQALPENTAYAELHSLLLPTEWPPIADNQSAIAGYIHANGLDRFQAVVSQGQYAFADGMFFGGTEATWVTARCARS